MKKQGLAPAAASVSDAGLAPAAASVALAAACASGAGLTLAAAVVIGAGFASNNGRRRYWRRIRFKQRL